MEYLPLIGTVALIHLLAVMSPGPDFVMCVKNALTHSRKTGIWTAVGFGAGISVHVFYCLAGLGLIISKSILIFSVIKFLGAAYLIYIGFKSAFSKSSKIEIGESPTQKEISPWAAIKMGFLTNVLNPKATLFFLSLFTLVISPETPLLIREIMGGIMVLQTILWFSLVSIFLSQKKIRLVFDRFQNLFNKSFGAILIALGLKVALSQR